MDEKPDLISRLGNLIMRVRHATYMATQGRKRPQMDGWVGADAYVEFLRAARPMMMDMLDPKLPAGEFKFMDVKFKRDASMPPRSIVVCAGGAPVRRLALDFPEYDNEAIVDHPDLLRLEIAALRYFEKGDRMIEPNAQQALTMISGLPPPGESPKLHEQHVSLERLLELGLLFREQRGRTVALGLTLMGREALRQHDAQFPT